MSHDQWYAMADLPEVRAIVRVWWMAFGQPRQFDVVRTWRASSRSWGWSALDPETREFIALPPRGRDRQRWAIEPVCWQPMDASIWVWPGEAPRALPPHHVPRLVGTDYLLREVDAAEMEEASRESERDRDDAGYRKPERAQETMRSRWWTDIGVIRYEPAGSVSPRMAEGRVLRALAWCGAGHGLTLRADTAVSVLARLAATAGGEMAEVDQRWHGLPRFQPLPLDHDDFLVAMGWFAQLNPPEAWGSARKAWGLNRVQRIMVLRASRMAPSFADIADLFDVSATRTRQLYMKGCDGCWRASNGMPARGDVVAVDHMRALRERNRTHRRASGACGA